MEKIKFIAKGLFLMIVLFIPVWAIGGVLEYRRDIKNFSSLPVLKLKIPSEEKRAETSYMVAFVHPAYEQKMAEQRNQWQQAYDALLEARGISSGTGTTYRKVDVAKISYTDSIKKYLQTDLEQILLAKKIRVLDVFKTRDEMTFDQKKRAIYTFTPEISINVEPKIRSSQGEKGYREEGDIIVSGEVIFTLRESITGEKVWVKRMDATTITKPYKFVAQYKETYRQTAEADCLGGCVGPPAPKPMKPTVKEEDNSAEALAAALSEFYASLNNQLVKHIDTEEWEKYLAQAEKLRAEKRY